MVPMIATQREFAHMPHEILVLEAPDATRIHAMSQQAHMHATVRLPRQIHQGALLHSKVLTKNPEVVIVLESSVHQPRSNIT